MNEKYEIDCVLLIDDDEITNFINSEVISEMQISDSIEATNKVETALDFIINCYLSNDVSKSLLIFLDLNMPVLDGFEFLDYLNQQTAIPFDKIDIIILTSSLHKIDQEKALKYSILDYIVKPLTQEKVKRALAKR